jgi:hypothetical protein
MYALVFLKKSTVTPSMDDMNQPIELHRRENVDFVSRMQLNLHNISPFNKTAVFLGKIEGLIKICSSEVSRKLK